MLVKIINGNYGHNENGRITAISLGGEVDLADDEARRLIKLGVAELVTERKGDNRGASHVATGENGEENETPSVNPTEDESGAEGKSEDDGEKGLALDETQLKTMTNTNLKKLAEDMGIDTSKMRVKDDFVKAILEKTVYCDNDDETPPVATAEDPIL